jgi:hypothetical protein
MKNIFVILFILLNKLSFSQLKICDTILLKKTLLYEYSLNTISLEDMILREKSLVEMKNNKPNYRLGVYYIDIESKKNRLNLCKNTRNSLVFNSDSIYRIFDSLNSLNITYMGCKYKSYNLEMEVVYLGYENINYIKKNKLKVTNGPIYKIIGIKFISVTK